MRIAEQDLVRFSKDCLADLGPPRFSDMAMENHKWPLFTAIFRKSKATVESGRRTPCDDPWKHTVVRRRVTSRFFAKVSGATAPSRIVDFYIKFRKRMLRAMLRKIDRELHEAGVSLQDVEQVRVFILRGHWLRQDIDPDGTVTLTCCWAFAPRLKEEVLTTTALRHLLGSPGDEAEVQYTTEGGWRYKHSVN